MIPVFLHNFFRQQSQSVYCKYAKKKNSAMEKEEKEKSKPLLERKAIFSLVFCMF